MCESLESICFFLCYSIFSFAAGRLCRGLVPLRSSLCNTYSSSGASSSLLHEPSQATVRANSSSRWIGSFSTGILPLSQR